MQQIQAKAAGLRLWVVVPSMPSEKCIIACPSPSLCAPMHSIVQLVVRKAVEKGYTGSTTAPDTFVAGHSMGGACASNLVEGYAQTSSNYSALVVMGAFVGGSDVAGFPTPVLTLGAELDGGSARPGALSRSLYSSDLAAASRGGPGSKFQLAQKPVVILLGLDHSSFCPGFRVPGDVWPADLPEDVSNRLIADHVAAFLLVHTLPNQERAFQLLAESMASTRKLLSPLLAGIALEADFSAPQSAPWCEVAQRRIAGLSAGDDDRLFLISEYLNVSKEFEHSHVHFKTSDKSRTSTFNISGHNAYFSHLDIADSCSVPAQEIGCKLASAARIGQQLNASTRNTPSCKDVNEHAIQTAKSLLGSTEEGARALARYASRGRGICLEEDVAAPFNIGPLFINERIRVSDNQTCLIVQSIKLGPTPLDGPIFPGVHYCKLLSPARVIDYIMIDSLKPKSGCLNK